MICSKWCWLCVSYWTQISLRIRWKLPAEQRFTLSTDVRWLPCKKQGHQINNICSVFEGWILAYRFSVFRERAFCLNCLTLQGWEGSWQNKYTMLKPNQCSNKKAPDTCLFILIALLIFKSRTLLWDKNSFLGQFLCKGIYKWRKVQAISSRCITYNLQ